MSAWLIWRLIKFVTLALFVAGVFSSAYAEPRRGRSRALGLTTLGFVGVWVAGYVLMKLGHRQLNEPWISWGMAASWVSLTAVMVQAHRATISRVVTAVALAGLFDAIAVMVIREVGAALFLLMALGSALLGGLVAWALGPAPQTSADEPDQEASWRWFRVIARCEGLSLIALVLIGMPLRRATGISLDGGTGALGWLHGALFLVYLQALVFAGRTLKWSWRRMFAGAGLSLLPFGTFALEWWVERQSSKSSGEASAA